MRLIERRNLSESIMRNGNEICLHTPQYEIWHTPLTKIISRDNTLHKLLYKFCQMSLQCFGLNVQHSRRVIGLFVTNNTQDASRDIALTNLHGRFLFRKVPEIGRVRGKITPRY